MTIDTATHEPSEAPAQRVRWWQRQETKGVFVLWFIFTLLGLALCWVPAWLMGPSASEQMTDIKFTMTLLTAAAAPVQALIWAILLYSLVKWRYKGEGPPPDDAPGFEGNAPTVLVWAIVSALLTLFVFVWGLMKIATVPTLGGFDVTPSDQVAAVEVNVIGNQWAWTFEYPELGGFKTNRLVLPVETNTNFEVTSVDVIHSFWVVDMGIKVDANPGAVTRTNVTPQAEGVYAVRCAELCGILHAAMGTEIEVVSMDEFDTWVEEQRALLAAAPPAEAIEGEGGH